VDRILKEEFGIIKEKSATFPRRAAWRPGHVPLLLLGLLPLLNSPARAQAAFSVKLDLKFAGAIDLRTYDSPFSFSKDLLADTTASIL